MGQKRAWTRFCCKMVNPGANVNEWCLFHATEVLLALARYYSDYFILFAAIHMTKILFSDHMW